MKHGWLTGHCTAGRPPARSVSIIGTRGYPSHYGGFETLLRYLVPYLVEHGWSVVVYHRDRTRGNRLSHNGRVESVYTPGIERRSASTLSFGLTASLHSAIRRPDVALVLNVANGYWLPALKAAGVRTVMNVDGIEWARAKWNYLGKRVFYQGAQLAQKWADRLVFDAEAIRDVWRNDFGATGEVIPYGGVIVDHAKQDGDIPTRPYALYVARFVPENSTEEFFEAVPTIAESHPVVIVGSSGYGGYFDEKARQLQAEVQNIRWLGHVADDNKLNALWHHCGAYFHGHTVGGTNPALVQAMASGAPTVAVDTVYNREVLGECGLYCTQSAVAIGDEMTSLLEDLPRRRSLTRAAKARARELYDWRAICGSYERILTELREQPTQGECE